jgi:hypothetical protein
MEIRMKKILCMAMCAMMCSGSFAMNMFTRQLPPGALQNYAGIAATCTPGGDGKYYITLDDYLLLVSQDGGTIKSLPTNPMGGYEEGQNLGVKINGKDGIIRAGTLDSVVDQLASLLREGWKKGCKLSSMTLRVADDEEGEDATALLNWYSKLSDDTIYHMAVGGQGLVYEPE